MNRRRKGVKRKERKIMIKDKRVAYAIYIVVFMVVWNVLHILFSGSKYNLDGRIDVATPVVLAIVTGYLFFIAEKVNINDELKLARDTEGAVIIDVRDADEYAQGHIPGAINIPAHNIEAILEKLPDKSTPLFTYCLRGSRSRGMAKTLKSMGYTQVINMGGIDKYKGELEH